MKERLSWLRRAIAATDKCENGDFASLYQEILDTVRDEDGNELAEQTAPMIVMGLFKEAVNRGHLHLEIGLELMSRGVSNYETDPEWHDVPISTRDDDAQLDFDNWDEQCIPGHIRHHDEWVVARKDKLDIEGESYFRGPVNYWQLPEDLPPQPMIRVASFYMRTAKSARANERWQRSQRQKDEADA